MTDRENSATRYQLLDILRGLAVLWLVWFHMYGMYQYHLGSHDFRLPDPAKWMVQVFSKGGFGSQMFFVISGYCVMAIARKSIRENEPWSRFLRRRLVRIYVPLWFSLVLVLLLNPIAYSGLLDDKPVTLDSLKASIPQLTWLEWLRTVTLTQVFYSPGFSLPRAFATTNGVYWFMAITVQFYVVVTIAVASGRWFWWVIGAVTLVSIPFGMFDIYIPWLPAGSPRPDDLTGLFISYWPMFASGATLYYLFEKGFTPERVLGTYARPAGLTLSIVMFVSLSYCTLFVLQLVSLNDRTLFALGFALLLWPVHLFDAQFRRLVTTSNPLLGMVMKCFILIGAMSFSIYLVHMPLLRVIPSLVHYAIPGNTGFLVAGISGVFVVVWAYPFYLYCEKPFLKSRAAAPTPVRLPIRSDAASDIHVPHLRGSTLVPNGEKALSG